MLENKVYALAVHGGAGDISKSIDDAIKQKYLDGISEALAVGEKILKKNGSSIDCVSAVVECLENNLMFNAGRGSVLNSQGKHEMDASIMDGGSLNCGAVAGISNIKNPIKLAKKILTKSDHIFLIGEGANEFAKLNDIKFETDDYFYTEKRMLQWKKANISNDIFLDHSDDGVKKKGTVGAVAIDFNGDMAAATSTGGMTNKKFGRVGDSPIIGAGTYANNETCAVSCTGHGEEFLRHVVGHSIHSQMLYGKKDLECSVSYMLNEVLKNGDGGIISIDNNGKVVCKFNTTGMFHGALSSNGYHKVSIWS